MKNDFFYSPSTKLYVSRKPLNIDARVKEAAEKAQVTLDWDDEGRINNIDFDNTKKLMQNLDAKILTPNEYWAVFNDAVEANDEDMVKELCSNKYTEWLDRVYLSENDFIESPEVVDQYKYQGTVEESQCPHGRPGWFNPEDNIGDTGEPLSVEEKRAKFATSWKYWSPDLSVTKLGACAPIRGYVTSVGKPSYDLGIPVDSEQPKLMIRECRTEPLEAIIDAEILEEAQTVDDGSLIPFLEKHGQLFATSKDSLIYKLREQFIDRLGDLSFEKYVQTAANRICNFNNTRERYLEYDYFYGFIGASKHDLKDALEQNKDVVFVMGHKNPDTDTVISSLFEAYRNSLVDENTVYVPVVQSEKIPDEVNYLVGGLADKILLTNDELYEQAKETGLARWISVDQNKEPEVQKYFISIVDHHVVSETAKNRDMPKTLEMLGSTVALITRKFRGMGYGIDYKMARVLYGAALMDTENRVEHKMTVKDKMLMDCLKCTSGVHDDNTFYGQLMSHLLNTDDAEILFGRDYKEDWGFGFAVAKIKNGFSEDGELLKKDLVDRLYSLAEKNNVEKNFPLTLLKITDYKEDNETVNRERIYYVMNNENPEFKEVVKSTLDSIIKFEFSGENLEYGNDHIDFWGGGLQLSRKKTAPVVEPISAAFNRYFFSPTINKWVKRDFQKKTKMIQGDYSTDEEGRINHITYEEAKDLAQEQSFELLSLSEYWKVLNDAKEISDIQMIKSLQGSNFVEFLDTKIVDLEFMIDHDGPKRKIVVPEGNPGLIHPDKIDLKTGLPTKVYRPNKYGEPELWRYWQPDSDLVIPCRSYIFLLDQPCLDGKFHPGESFPNLGLRPVVREVVDPKVSLSWDDKYLTVEIFEEGEVKVKKWPKKIWET